MPVYETYSEYAGKFTIYLHSTFGFSKIYAIKKAHNEINLV